MENEKPFFSIVIPTYNHGHLIKRCLDSIVAQTYTHWEAIVVNNFSNDNTVEIVESYRDPRIRLVNNANHGIIAVSRNKGIELAKGDWICFLDSDDWYYPDKLEVTSQYVEQCDIIYHNLDIYNIKGRIWRRRIKGRKLIGNIQNDLLVQGNGIPCSSVAVKSEIIKKVQGFSDEKELFAIEDSDCWIRIAEYTQNFKYINKSLGGYWIGDNTSVSIKQVDRERKLVERHINKLELVQQRLAWKNMFYRQARIYHKLKLYPQARLNYQRALSIRNPLSIILYIISFFNISI